MLSCIGLSGCSEHSHADRLNNYLERLARVLALESSLANQLASDNTLTHRPRYQWGYTGELAKRDGQSRSTISILDFLSLYGCDLQLVIAERNSSLGKFAPSSQSLIQYLRFLHHAPACIKQLENEQNIALAEQLQQDQQQKQQQLPLLIWKAILNEQEARLFWKKPSTLDDYPEQVSIAPELAIKRLTYLSQQWMSGHYNEGLNEIETLLGDMRTGDGGALLMAFDLLTKKLNQGNQMIEHYLKQEPCFNGRPAIKINILENVIEKFFVGDIQHWTAALNRRYYSLIDAYHQLELAFKNTEPELYSHWRQQRDNQFKQGLASSAKHVRQLKRALQACTPKEATHS